MQEICKKYAKHMHNMHMNMHNLQKICKIYPLDFLVLMEYLNLTDVDQDCQQLLHYNLYAAFDES